MENHDTPDGKDTQPSYIEVKCTKCRIEFCMDRSKVKTIKPSDRPDYKNIVCSKSPCSELFSCGCTIFTVTNYEAKFDKKSKTYETYIECRGCHRLLLKRFNTKPIFMHVYPIHTPCNKRYPKCNNTKFWIRYK